MLEIIIPAIFKYYGYAVEHAHWDGREGGYQCITYDSSDILDYFSIFISNCDEVLKDIENVFPDETWCDVNLYSSSEHEIYKDSWESFSSLVKYKNRYFFLQETDDNKYYEKYSPLSILNIIEEWADNFGLIKTLPKNTALYRGRIFNSTEAVKTDDANLGSPPSIYAENGRMNAAGISVFYAAESSDTSLKEIMTPCLTTESIAVVGKFETVNDLKYLDLTEISNIPMPSIFDIEKYNSREVIMFFRDLNKQLTMPIDNLEAIEYVPTQIFAEYFKMNTGLNGIKYNSAQDKNGTCIVLFFDNEQCINDNKKENYQKRCELRLTDAVKYKLSFSKIANKNR